MFSIPISLTAADILGPEDSMSRDGYQHCVLRLTTGRNPRWYCRYTKRVITGPRQSRSIQTRKYFGLKEKMTRREAEKACAVFRLAVNSAKEMGVRESQVPLANWIATYEATYLPTLKPNSQAVYRSTLNAIRERFGAMRLCDISRDAIQQWFNELAKTRARATLQRMLATFTSLFEEAIASDSYEARNPCERVKLPVGQRSTVELRSLTPDEVRRLLAVVEEPLDMMVRIALFCGLRIGEILALNYEDCRNGSIRVSKNKAQYSDEITTPKSAAGARVVPLGPVVVPTGSGPLFSTPYRTAHEALRKAFVAAGIAIDGTAWHALRRTFATYFEAAGAATLREQMGHSNETMSLQYVRRGFDDHAAAVNRMAGFLLGDTGATTKQ